MNKFNSTHNIKNEKQSLLKIGVRIGLKCKYKTNNEKREFFRIFTKTRRGIQQEIKTFKLHNF